jgi:hypothetical protein
VLITSSYVTECAINSESEHFTFFSRDCLGASKVRMEQVLALAKTCYEFVFAHPILFFSVIYFAYKIWQNRQPFPASPGILQSTLQSLI